MPTKTSTKQITFRYRTVDSATGVTRKTAKRLRMENEIPKKATACFAKDAL